MTKKRIQPTSKRTTDRDSSNLGMYVEDRLGNNRSGLDPLANRREAAYAGGYFIRGLLTGKLRIQNGVAQLLMLIIGVFLCLPVVLSIIRWLDPADSLNLGAFFGTPSYNIIALLIVTYLGVMLLYTALMSIRMRR